MTEEKVKSETIPGASCSSIGRASVFSCRPRKKGNGINVAGGTCRDMQMYAFLSIIRGTKLSWQCILVFVLNSWKLGLIEFVLCRLAEDIYNGWLQYLKALIYDN